MSSILKKFRSSLSIGGIWGAAAAAASSAFDLIRPGSIGLDQLMENTLIIGSAGFVGGVLFSLALVLGEGRRGTRPLPPHRGAVWGFLGGLLMPLVMSSILNGNLDWALAILVLPTRMVSLLPWAILGGMFGAVTAWIATHGDDESHSVGTDGMLASAQPASPLEQDLANVVEPRPRNVL